MSRPGPTFTTAVRPPITLALPGTRCTVVTPAARFAAKPGCVRIEGVGDPVARLERAGLVVALAADALVRAGVDEPGIDDALGEVDDVALGDAAAASTEAPIASIFPPAMRTAPFSIGAPSTGTTSFAFTTQDPGGVVALPPGRAGAHEREGGADRCADASARASHVSSAPIGRACPGSRSGTRAPPERTATRGM